MRNQCKTVCGSHDCSLFYTAIAAGNYLHRRDASHGCIIIDYLRSDLTFVDGGPLRKRARMLKDIPKDDVNNVVLFASGRPLILRIYD